MVTGPTILVVDDDEPILDLMRSLLRQYGFSPETASSGTEAMRRVEASSPDLILLDLTLTDMEGAQVLEWIRHRDHRVPVVILSGHPVSEEEVRELGAVGSLQKPFEVRDLIALIRKHLELVGC